MTEEILRGFTQRDWAILVWLVIFFIWIMFNPNIRESIRSIIKMMFMKNVLIIFVLMFAYILLQLYLFKTLQLWRTILVKALVVWIIGVAIGSVININNIKKNRDTFLRIIKKALELTIVIDFIINFYTFPFLIELILLPTLVVAYTMSAHSERDKKNNLVRKFMNFVIGTIGVIILYYVVKAISLNFEVLFTSENFLSLLLPVFMIVTFIPFLYALAVYVIYDELIHIANHLLKNHEGLGRYFIKKLILKYKFSMDGLNKFNREGRRYIVKANSKRDINQIINLEYKYDGIKSS